MKKALAIVVTACVVFGSAAAFAQGARNHANQQQMNRPQLDWQCRPSDGNAPAHEHGKQQANRRISAEERAEMQAAFGKGATVVDIITGQTIRL